MQVSDRARGIRFAVILLVAAVPRIWAAVWDQGIFWPDEIFQTTEPAHHFAFGYGYVAWEFQEGARSWLFPGAIGLWWKLLVALGVTAAPVLIISAKLGMVALGLVGIYASMRIAEKLAGPEAAVICGIFSAAFPPSIVYGSRCMTEMASGPLIAVAALLAFDRSRAKLIVAGCLAGLAIHLRFQNGLITVGLLAWLLAQRRWPDAGFYALGATVIGLAGGLLDLFTWGTAFHSFIANVRFNLIEGRSAEYGVAPLSYYLGVFWSAVGVSALAVAIGLGAAARRATGLLVIVLVYTAAHTAVAHKEFRFLMPIVPLVLGLTGAGLAVFINLIFSRPKAGRKVRTQAVRPVAWILAGVLAAAMGWRTVNASFEDFGQYDGPLLGPQPLWHYGEAVNRLFWKAGERADLCGLAVVAYAPLWSGGYTYLHRDVPILWMMSVEKDAANYVVAPVEFPLSPEYSVIETIGDARLARRPGSCSAPPPSYTRLFPK
jgi:GPI mannosyltransferase 3